MITKRQDAERIACSIMAIVSHAQGFDVSNDGFCEKCPAGNPSVEWEFRNSGRSLRYMRDAVVEKLARDGYTVPKDILEEMEKLFRAAGVDDDDQTQD